MWPHLGRYNPHVRFRVVDENDIPGGGGGLPAELQGKTPAEIATYYADRESNILANARRMVNEAQETNRSTPPEAPRTPPTTDPVTRDEFNSVLAASQDGLIQVAQMTASQGKPDWARLLPEIRKVMDQMNPLQKVNSAVWEEAYFNVRGRMTDTLVTEARRSALGLEQPAPPPAAPTPPRSYTSDEMRVIEGLGVTSEMYGDTEKKLADNFQPFTTDNRNQRRSA